MLKIFQPSFRAQLLASVAMLSSPRFERQLIRAMTRAVYKIVIPGTIGAGYLDCLCLGPQQLVDNCPYHGREARRLARG